ncbi:MAG: YciI family protein [Polyangiaceae bacterium]
MKYMILTFGDQATMLEQRTVVWVKEMIQFMMKLAADLKSAGELVSAEGLADPTKAKTVRFQGGVPVATDGPFAESKEALAGFWIVDVESEARALAIASRIVAFIERPIEVRQVMDVPPEL